MPQNDREVGDIELNLVMSEGQLLVRVDVGGDSFYLTPEYARVMASGLVTLADAAARRRD